jgi:CRP-like cAMP-binding protein
VPSLKNDGARRLLRPGRFVDAAAGEVLTVEGQPVRDIAMILSGICHIDRGGRLIASISTGALVGEMTLSTGGPATATVRTAGPARLFLIDRSAFVAFLQRHPEALADVERSVAGDLRLKLAETSTRLTNAMGDQSASPP